ncbi:hypothetical protein, partial [Pseudomonas syringae group genomosp. 7]|uniref:hypothetical protein n=1 Tax=Pseudomonas syringae group genomosp. 7 TaxID=251699 RepID=UPI00376F7A18
HQPESSAGRRRGRTPCVIQYYGGARGGCWGWGGCGCFLWGVVLCVLGGFWWWCWWWGGLWGLMG